MVRIGARYVIWWELVKEHMYSGIIVGTYMVGMSV